MTTLSFILIVLLGLSFIVLTSYLLSQIVLLLFFWGAIYVPAQEETIKKIINFAEIKPGEKAVDLGSGDGRVVIALARAGAQAHGYEINPFLVRRAKGNIRKAGLSDKAFIHHKSFWGENLSRFDVVIVFGMSHMMKRLETKLKKESKNKAKVIAVCFPIPGWTASQKDGGVFLYRYSHLT